MKKYAEPKADVVLIDDPVVITQAYSNWQMLDPNGNPTGEGGSIGTVVSGDEPIVD